MTAAADVAASTNRWLTLLREVEAQEERAAGPGAGGDSSVRHESEGWVPLERALKSLQVVPTDGGAARPMGPFGAAPAHNGLGAGLALGTPPLAPRAHIDPSAIATPPGAAMPRAGADNGAAAEAPDALVARCAGGVDASWVGVGDAPPDAPGLTEADYSGLTVPVAKEVLATMGRLLVHDNRFVREAALGIVELVLRRGLPLREEAPAVVDEVLTWILRSLQDNWSQVRYRATHAAEAYVDHYVVVGDHPRLLPRLCLNRYYIAEGVRVVTQRIWERVVGSRGIELVHAHLPAFVAYYIAQSKERNHAVREAACLCLSELVTKVPDVNAEVSNILDVIDYACDDCSWPVRDVACVCLGRIISKYPEETRARHGRCYERILYQAVDPIPSVRRHAAEALGDYAKISPEYWDRVRGDVEGMLKRIHEQPQTTVRATDLENVSQFGVAKRIHDNDMASHTNTPMFSCGSLAPGPSTARVLNTPHTGCSGGAGIPRTGLDPWYATDTAVHAVYHLSACTAHHEGITKTLLPLILPTLAVKTFIHYPAYWQSVWGRVPAIVKNIGKRKVTLWVNDVIPAMFEALECDSQLAAAAAADCIRALQQLYGESVWASKLGQREAGMMRHPMLQG